MAYFKTLYLIQVLCILSITKKPEDRSRKEKACAEGLGLKSIIGILYNIIDYFNLII